ncbi:MICOS complex subunit MIC60-1-like [Haliotis rufescens]|uniref:MICOS complex subunit MIC60-1-like n=1 Tax=Haliotis rufescens TaxID=6454 RepID=UPI00201F7463|nr:MICOS complex subunit MIC60-1-like [Haliotis rufescens]
MWKASSARISVRSQCAKCRRFFSNTKNQQTNGGGAQPTPPPPPPAESRSGGGVFFKLLGLTTLTTGGVVGYAWYDPSFKKTLEDNIPYSKDAFGYIFPYLPDPASFKTVEAPAPKSEVKPLESRVTKSSQKPTPTPQPAPKPAPKKEEKVDPAVEKERQKRETQRQLKEKEADNAAQNAALEVILENLAEATNDLVRQATDAQKRVVDTTKTHTQLLRKAMDDTKEILQKDSQWQEVSTAFENREDAFKESKTTVYSARQNLEKLRAAIADGKQNVVTKKNKALISAQETLNKHLAELGQASSQVSRAESEAKVMSRYKDLVDKGRKQFQKELESILPDVKLGDKKGKKLTEEELNSLIAHAHRRIEQLQKQLAEQLALESQHIDKALEQQVKEDEKLAAMRVKMEAEKMQGDFGVEKEKWASEARVEFEQELRQQLARQAAAHSDHLKDVLNVQHEELDQQFEREMHTRILEERQTFQTEVAGWIARLKGIETAVDGRAEAEKIARNAQELWLACIALNGAIRLGREEGVEWEDKIKPLANEIVTISDASGQHPFVETIIRTIPEEALKRGVWTEESLKERFPKVKRICKRVAMVDETGGTLFKYFLSYIQSFFIFDSVYAKSLDDEIDLDKFDTFAILAHAEFWLEKGDMDQAIRFLNQLQGAPRRVASDWIKEAKLMAETRQAAYALMAFASASGLGTLF